MSGHLLLLALAAVVQGGSLGGSTCRWPENVPETAPDYFKGDQEAHIRKSVEEIVDWLARHDITHPDAVSIILGNLYQESQFVPTACEAQQCVGQSVGIRGKACPDTWDECGTRNINGYTASGVGLLQWSDARRKEFREYCKEKEAKPRYSCNKLKGQLAFIETEDDWHEAKTCFLTANKGHYWDCAKRWIRYAAVSKRRKYTQEFKSVLKCGGVLYARNRMHNNSTRGNALALTSLDGKATLAKPTHDTKKWFYHEAWESFIVGGEAKCLHLKADGAVVVQDCRRTDRQRWKLFPLKGGWYQIAPRLEPDLCLSAQEAGVLVKPCSKTSSRQLWYLQYVFDPITSDQPLVVLPPIPPPLAFDWRTNPYFLTFLGVFAFLAATYMIVSKLYSLRMFFTNMTNTAKQKDLFDGFDIFNFHHDCEVEFMPLLA